MLKKSIEDYRDFKFIHADMGIEGTFLCVPYPPSNNRNSRFGSRGIYKDKKTYNYISAIKTSFIDVLKPISEPLQVSVSIYPNLPKDHVKRMKKEGLLWWLSVRSLDIDNSQKIIFDSLNGLLFKDDKQIVRMYVKKMCPDSLGARVELKITEFRI